MTNPSDRPGAAESAPLPPATTLGEARAAVVGRRYPLFEESFRLFDEAGGFRPTFIWPPLLFGLFWFVYRRMYLEALLAGLAGLVIMFLGEAGPVEGGDGLVMLISIGFSLFLAVTGRWLYWKAVDRRLEQAMRLFPREPGRALAWLKWKGGVDPLAVVLTLAGLAVLGRLALVG
ncbi:MAG: DUF2628 domain-containing protein [Candidatus Adiutrix sp.]|jgi:hypothetical protein|nr:DUF2628 domain-containing protein [Candidatus Adiutrix sp.]